MSPQPQPREWSRDYVTFMRCDAGDEWLPEVERQISSWLREKELDLDLSGNHDLVESDRSVSVRRVADGGTQDLRLTLVEDQGDTGMWSTELLAHDEPGGHDWIHLAVTNDQGRFVDVPRLANYLIQVLPLGDGSIEFSAKPRLLRSDDLDGLVSVLADTERHGLVFVAGTDLEAGISIAAFQEQVGRWVRQVRGLAQVVVLDPAATGEFETKVGTRFAAPPWTIRTYQPAVDFTDPSRASRHRILGTSRLTSMPDSRTRLLLGDIARRQAAERELPTEVRKVRRRFERIENRRLVEALEPAEPTPPTPAPIPTPAPPAAAAPQKAVDESAEKLSLVRRILHLEQITEATLRDIAARLTAGRAQRESVSQLRARIDGLQERVNSLEDQRSSLLTSLEDEQAELEVTRLDLDNREGKIRWLEARLKDKGDYEAEYLQTPAEFLEERPGNYDELLDRVDALPGVEFTGDQAEALELSAVDTNEAALRTAWDAVLALADYAKARADGVCETGLDQYLKDPPAGCHTVPPGKFAATETAITMKGHGDERVFPVPTEVHPSGHVEMKAHFKLARIGMISPRMHVFDGHPQHPTVYIGYLGPHLTNTQTN